MSKILVDKGVLVQALEALEADNSKLWPSDRRTAAYFNLRAAVAEPVQEPERATVGPHLQKQARRLLEQLAANRPRRALDVDSTRRLLEVISAPGETDKLIADLIRSAWEWGVSCEVDDVRWGEAGDSHNQWLRDRTNDAATRLHAAVLTSGKKPNKQADLDSPERPYEVGARLAREGHGISAIWGAVQSDSDMEEAQRGYENVLAERKHKIT